ncbi:MAG: hypothetical protein Q7K26_02175 [bacterium]|nr:hypothetical protein [bacterium]
MNFMLSKIRIIKLILLSIGCACLSVGAKGVCPELIHDKVQQIYIFDGSPDELAYLAPDDDDKAANTYTLSYIYEKGRIVTIRCTYESGYVFDVSMKNRINLCNFSRSKAGTPILVCN